MHAWCSFFFVVHFIWHTRLLFRSNYSSCVYWIYKPYSFGIAAVFVSKWSISVIHILMRVFFCWCCLLHCTNEMFNVWFIFSQNLLVFLFVCFFLLLLLVMIMLQIRHEMVLSILNFKFLWSNYCQLMLIFRFIFDSDFVLEICFITFKWFLLFKIDRNYV